MTHSAALSMLARAIGLAQSLEHPIIPLDQGATAVAGEIVILLQAVQDHLHTTIDP